VGQFCGPRTFTGPGKALKGTVSQILFHGLVFLKLMFGLWSGVPGFREAGGEVFRGAGRLPFV